MASAFLNLATAAFPENREHGLMVCGINWGGPQDSAPLTKHEFGPSFFSDGRYVAGPSPYRRNIIRWFGLFGHPLAGSEPIAGPFERSIVQTNWRSDQSPHVKGEGAHAELVREWGNFEFHVEQLKPRLIMFMGVNLLETLNSTECAARADRLLGTREPLRWETRPVVPGASKHGVSVGIQAFERAQIVALPHPSWPRSDDYIASFKDVVSPLVAKYKSGRNFRP